MNIIPSSIKYLHKLLLFGAVISILPAAVIGFFSYNKASELLQEKVREGNAEILQQTMLRVEQLLYSVDHSLALFVNSPLMNSALHMQLQPSEFQVINDLHIGLTQLQTYDLGVNDYKIINLQQNWIVDPTGKQVLTESLREANAVEEYSKAVKASFWTLSREPAYQSSIGCDLALVKKLPQNMSVPAGLIVVKLPCSSISRQLSRNDKLGSAMILNASGEVIVGSNSVPLPTEAAEEDLITLIRETPDKSGSFVRTIQHEPRQVTFQRSDYTGWIYVSVVSVRQITGESKAIGWFTLMICLITIVGAIIALLQGSRLLYRPILTLQKFIHGQVDNASRKPDIDEFAYIRDGIATIMNDRKQLSEQIAGQGRQLKEYFVLKLLRGEWSSGEIKDRLAEFSFPSDNRWWKVIAVEIDTLKETEYREKDRDLLLFAIGNLMSDLIPEDRRLLPVVMTRCAVLVISLTSENEEQVKQEVDALVNAIRYASKAFLKLPVSAGISRTYRQPDKIAEAYQETVESLKYKIRLGSESVLYFQEIEPGLSRSLSYPDKEQDEIFDAIQVGDKMRMTESYGKLMDAIFGENRSHRDYQIWLFYFLIVLIKRFQGSSRFLQKNQKLLFDRLTELSYRNEIVHWLMDEVLEPVFQQVSEKREMHYSQISEQVRDIIHNKYDTDITLESCAAEISYHPNYVKRVFRQETGISFSDYLSVHRMEMAKKWLIHTDMKVSEIAEKLCYNNAQNFIRYFRKMHGVTPGDFRKMSANEHPAQDER